MSGPDQVFRACFIAVFTGLSAARLYFRIRSGALRDRVFTRTEGVMPVVLRWTLGAPLLAGTAVYIFAPGAWPWMYLPLPSAARIAGAALGVVAVVLIVLVHEALGRNFSSGLIIRREHRLVRTGPYRFVRHPMYSAYLLLFIAAFLISGSWLVGAAGAAVIATLMTVRLVREEALLLARFGAEYELYRRTTGMFLPRLGSMPKRRAVSRAAELEAESDDGGRGRLASPDAGE